MKRQHAHHARSAKRRPAPLTVWAASLALLSMLAMGTGALGHAHHELQHSDHCASGLACPLDDTPEQDASAPALPNPALDHDCELCDLIKGNQAKLIAALTPTGLLNPERSQRLTSDDTRPVAQADHRPFYARPPPARL